MATARANFNSVVSADATQFHATMRRVATTAKTVGSRIGKSMANATRAMGRVAASAGKAALAIGAVGSAIAAAAFTSAVKEMYDLGGSLSDLSSRTGIAVSELAILQRAFQDNGISADKLGPIINKMQKGIVDFGSGLSTQVRAFERLGISYDQIRDKSPLQQFEMLQKAINGLQDPTIRAGTAMEIFGRSGGELQALFQSSGPIEKATSSLGSAAGILERNADTFDRISDLMQSAAANLKLFVLGVAEVAAPKILAALERFNEIDFADLGQRFVKGLNLDNTLKLMKAVFDVAARYLGNQMILAAAKVLEFFENEWNRSIDIWSENFSKRLKQGLLAAISPLFVLKDIVEMETSERNGIGTVIADSMIARLEGEDVLDLGGAIDRLKDVGSDWMQFTNDPFSGGGRNSGYAPQTPAPAAKKGLNFFGVPYEREDKEYHHSASLVKPDAAATARFNAQQAMHAAAMQTSTAATAGFRGLAGLGGMQVARLAGIGPGQNNAFSRDRERLGIGSGLVTGGLGAKRAVGGQKDEAATKRQIELAKSTDEHLMDIKEKVGKALTVSQ